MRRSAGFPKPRMFVPVTELLEYVRHCDVLDPDVIRCHCVIGVPHGSQCADLHRGIAVHFSGNSML